MKTRREGIALLDGFKALLLEEYAPGQWALVFFLYSFAGWCWEVMLSFATKHRFVNRGFLTGPILPIYGFGALTVLLVCVPVKDSALLVALFGATAATLLELATGAVMEALFHVRYWDYSNARWNVHGYVCAKSTVVWAFFSAMIVRVVHPFARRYVLMIPAGLSAVLAGTLIAFALADTVSAVRRALDLRALLESMERYAKELEAMHGGLDGVSQRIGEMIRAFGQSAHAGQEELALRMQRLSEARERIARQVQERRLTASEAAKERFAAFERALSDIADIAPDAEALREEIRTLRERYEKQTEALRAAGAKRAERARALLRRNPSAVSRRHGRQLEALREEAERQESNGR